MRPQFSRQGKEARRANPWGRGLRGGANRAEAGGVSRCVGGGCAPVAPASFASAVTMASKQEMLENEVQSLRAQMESERIDAEQASLAIEERYSQLAEEYANACTQRESAEADAAALRKEVADFRRAGQQHDVRVIELEKQIERHKVEIRELHTDKRSILQVLDQRRAEVTEKNESIRAYIDKIVSLTSQKGEVDSKLREVQQDQNRFEAAQARLAQENHLLKQHNEWLNEELSTKSTVLLEDRKRASDEIVELRSKTTDLETSFEEKSVKNARLEKKLEEIQAKLIQSEEACVGVKKKASSQEVHFQKEIGTAKRLIDLYQESAERGKTKISELEGIVKELEVHMKQTAEAHAKALGASDTAKKQAQAEITALKDQLQRNLEAASQGYSPHQPPRSQVALATPVATTSDKDARAIQMLELSPAAAAATMLKEGMSLTEMYGKYVEMSDAWRQERAAKNKLQSYLDTILSELERKAPLINEQKLEYERLLKSHNNLTKRLEDAIGERRTLEAAALNGKKGQQRLLKERKALEQQTEDLSRQVQVLLKEVEDIKAGRGAVSTRAPHPSVPAVSSGSVIDASNVITEHLVTFHDIKEIQEQNIRLLAVSRQLGEDNEARMSELKGRLEEENARSAQQYASELQALKSERERNEKLMQQIVRQRDLYKSLLAEREGAGGENGGVNGSASLSADTSDFKAAYQDLQKDFDKFKEESSKNARMLRDEASNYREDAGMARGEKAQIQAQLDFERERYTRLEEICSSQGKEIESLLQKNGSLTKQGAEYQQKLKDLSFDVDVCRDDLRREGERIAALNAEKDLLEKSEKRLSESLSAAINDKHHAQASTEALLKRYEEQESNGAKERERLVSENDRLHREHASVQKALLEERSRSRDVASASSGMAANTAARIAVLEVELKGATKTKDEADRKLKTLQSKVESLQSSLQKAEEKAALAALRSASTAKETAGQELVTVSASESDQLSSLRAQVKAAQEEASAAQEAAAAASGHLAQYKAMCAASDEALKAMKEAHESFKAQAENAAHATEKEMSKMQAKLSQAEAKVSQKQSLDAEEEKRRLAQEEALALENSKLREELSNAKKAVDLNMERISTLQKDVKEYHSQWRIAQSMYDKELISHAGDVKRLNTFEEESAKKQDTFEKLKSEVRSGQVALAESERKRETDRVSLTADLASLQARINDLEQQNRILHDEVQRLTSSSVEGPLSATAGAGQEANAEVQQVVQYLRREKETSDCQLSLLKQENVRLRKQVEHAMHSADDAKARLSAEIGKRKDESLVEQKHASLLEKVEQLNLLRESNAGLREENVKLQKQVKRMKLDLSKSNGAINPLEASLKKAEALLASKDEEISSIKDQSKRWETRTQQLLDRYGQVDVSEYERVCRALKDAEKAKEQVGEDIKAAVEEKRTHYESILSDLREDLAKAQRQEQIAKKQIFNIFNPDKLKIPEWIAARDRKAKQIADLEAKVEGMSEGRADADTTNAALRQEVEESKAHAKELEESLDAVKRARKEQQMKIVTKLQKAKALKEEYELLKKEYTSILEKYVTLQNSIQRKGKQAKAQAQGQGKAVAAEGETHAGPGWDEGGDEAKGGKGGKGGEGSEGGKGGKDNPIGEAKDEDVPSNEQTPATKKGTKRPVEEADGMPQKRPKGATVVEPRGGDETEGDHAAEDGDPAPLEDAPPPEEMAQTNQGQGQAQGATPTPTPEAMAVDAAAESTEPEADVAPEADGDATQDEVLGGEKEEAIPGEDAEPLTPSTLNPKAQPFAPTGGPAAVSPKDATGSADDDAVKSEGPSAAAEIEEGEDEDDHEKQRGAKPIVWAAKKAKGGAKGAKAGIPPKKKKKKQGQQHKKDGQ